MAFSHRLVTEPDYPALQAHMDKAIIGQMVEKASLDEHFDHVGVDNKLRADGTYDGV